MPLPNLEVFEMTRSAQQVQSVTLALSRLEAERARAHETGHQLGWDAAMAAQSAEVAQIRSDLGRNLQALAFTYQEARNHLLCSLAPLLSQICAQILPVLARESLPLLIVEQLMPFAEAETDLPALLTLPPANRTAVERLLSETKGLALQIREDAALPAGQVSLTLGQAETQIDLTRAVEEITATVQAYFTLHQESFPHG